ncbi:MAG: hypothetical protein C0603_09200 [Denitrovibrio sp.]|nr:MAG: hypothetical protein C0603_09200 [Denitrovibrio sp.]
MTDTNEPCQKSAGKLLVACGGETLELHLKKAVDVIDVDIDKKTLTDEQLVNKLEDDAIYSYGLNEIIEDANNILIILPDSTRKSGAERILPKLIEDIEKQGKTFHFIIAIGTHRPATEDELKKIVTPELYAKYSDKFIEHDSDNYDDHDFYGITKRKTTVLINKAYREHDTIITIGSVSYHYFAGYGGGRKLIMPGIAAKKSIMGNHKLALDVRKRQRHEKAVTGNLKNNPVHDDIVESIMIARSLHTFFAINTLVDADGDIIDMTCGDIFMSHLKAADILDEMSVVDASKKYDLAILSAGGFPKDINMVQAQKSLDRIVPLLAEKAKVVFFAECKDGYGNSFFKEFFDKSTSEEMLNDLLDEYQINRQTAYNLKTKLEAFDVHLYSDFSEADCARMGFTKITDLADVASMSDKAENVAFIPHAYNIFPK